MAEVINIYEQESWNNAKKYKQAEVVLHVQTVYIALKDNTNITPGTDATTWMPLGDFVAGGGIVNLATNLVNGISKPDGKTIEIDANGTLTVKAIKMVTSLPPIPQANIDILYIRQNADEFELFKFINGTFIRLCGSEKNIFENTIDDFPTVGKLDKIYIDKTTRIIYFWDNIEQKYSPMQLGEDIMLSGGGA